jgi:hypothetical protein
VTRVDAQVDGDSIDSSNLALALAFTSFTASAIV